MWSVDKRWRSESVCTTWKVFPAVLPLNSFVSKLFYLFWGVEREGGGGVEKPYQNQVIVNKIKPKNPEQAIWARTQMLNLHKIRFGSLSWPAYTPTKHFIIQKFSRGKVKLLSGFWNLRRGLMKSNRTLPLLPPLQPIIFWGLSWLKTNFFRLQIWTWT